MHFHAEWRAVYSDYDFPVEYKIAAYKHHNLKCWTHILFIPTTEMFSGVTLYDTLVVSAILVLCLYLYLTRHFTYWKKRGIPYVEPLPFFGNLKEAILQNLYVGIVLEHIYRKYKHERYVGIFAFDRPALLVNDLDLIRNIFVKDSQNFMNHNIRTDEKKDPIWTNFLFALKGETWKHVRHKLTPTFSSGKMKTMFYLVNNCAKNLAYTIDNISVDGSYFTLPNLCVWD